MKTDFEKYLADLAEHEQQKSLNILKNNPREIIKLFAGHRLNWLGDYFGNSNIVWSKIHLEINKIKFTGTSPELNIILKEKCDGLPSKLIDLMNTDQKVRAVIEKYASYSEEPILVRNNQSGDNFLVLDGTHRLLGKILHKAQKIWVWYPENEFELLPECEAHVVYDLIRGYIRHAKDEEGKIALQHSLKLLIRTYSNVKSLLQNRFNSNYVSDPSVQEVIAKVLESSN
ncbi:MAG: hypothetical protein AAGF07_05080 [Patescibacteria group bacterium]